MFTIIPYGQTAIRKQLGEFADAAGALISEVVPDAELPPVDRRPSVQLSHKEISDNEVEKILGFAGITIANAPIGIPALTQVQRFGRDFLLFPLADLGAHVAKAAPDVKAEYERYGDLTSFTDAREMTASEYLVAGLLECLRWCQAHRAALCIRW